MVSGDIATAMETTQSPLAGDVLYQAVVIAEVVDDLECDCLIGGDGDEGSGGGDGGGEDTERALHRRQWIDGPCSSGG